MTFPIRYVSISSDLTPVDFTTAVLDGFAPDGGLYVPDSLPFFSADELTGLKDKGYIEICSHILSQIIDPTLIPQHDLDELITLSFKNFEHPDITPLVPCPKREHLYILELFHGPTQSFKDIAMGLLIRTMDYLLARKGDKLNLVLATTGDTGPAAAEAAAGLQTLQCWPLFPEGLISKEQKSQMTRITASNIHPVAVTECSNGVDNLDEVILELFCSSIRRNRLKLSSVNSINWCRVMVQSVHYFYAYCQICKITGQKAGSPVTFSVPAGAFGNLFAGYLAKEMGLPINFICSVNANQTLLQAFNEGVFSPASVVSTYSSAIDIALPSNFWRFLYYASGKNWQKIKMWMDQLNLNGKFELDERTLNTINKDFKVISVSDDETLQVIHELYCSTPSYLIDPHGAVALRGSFHYQKTDSPPIVSLATAHPAKFPSVIAKALNLDKNSPLPQAALHNNLVQDYCNDLNLSKCELKNLKTFLIKSIESQSEQG